MLELTSERREEWKEERQYHYGSICDGCNIGYYEFKGFRYKCTICEDYNLCKDCMEKGTHEQHKLEKVIILRGKKEL